MLNLSPPDTLLSIISYQINNKYKIHLDLKAKEAK